MAKPHRNLRTMVKNEHGSAIESQFDCAFDAVSRRSSVVNSGQAFAADAFNLYGYNDRNELGQSSRYLGNNIAVTATPVPSEHRAYAYDPIGNRTQSTMGSLGWSYVSNELNQYTQQDVAGNGTDAFSYDDDGNLTAIDYGSSPDVAYTYDAENRLIAVAPPTPVAGDKKTEFLYDYMGRRVRKQVSTYTDGQWTLDTQEQKLYVYDGWNLIAEIDGSNTTYHIWGLDLSGTLQGAGGVGGLLGTFTGTAGYFALYDTNGNITDYLDAQGTVVAHYEYDPYGGTVTASGEKQGNFALRFSTKYLDEAGLYYYGYRYYSPGLGRWMTRDPIEEHAFDLFLQDIISISMLRNLSWTTSNRNIYQSFLNSPFIKIDAFGLRTSDESEAIAANILRQENIPCKKCGKNVPISAFSIEYLLMKTRFNHILSENQRRANCEPYMVFPPPVFGEVAERGKLGWDLSAITHDSYFTNCSGPSCGTGKGCAYTIRVGSNCYNTWEVNYISYGWLSRMCHEKYGKPDERTMMNLVSLWRSIKDWMLWEQMRSGAIAFARAGYGNWPFSGALDYDTRYEKCVNCENDFRGHLDSVWPNRDWEQPIHK